MAIRSLALVGSLTFLLSQMTACRGVLEFGSESIPSDASADIGRDTGQSDAGKDGHDTSTGDDINPDHVIDAELDQGSNDQVAADLSRDVRADLSVDIAIPQPDVAVADLAPPDVLVADLATPDVLVADLAAPDLAAPDLPAPDTAPLADLSPDVPLPQPDLLTADAGVDASDAFAVDSALDSSADGGSCSSLEISEMMIDPKGPDPDGEWFEIHNPTAKAVSLHNWQLKDKDASHTINAPTLTINPGGYVLLGRSRSGVTVDYDYSPSGTTSCAAEVCFNNASDFLELWNSSGFLVDRVAYGSGWPFASGAAMSLKSRCLDNSTPANWCKETVSSGDAQNNLGTPRAAAKCK